MLYLIHDDDGRITQSNKVFSPEGYDKQLHDAGVRFVKHDLKEVLPLDSHYVAGGELIPRGRMILRLNKRRFKADGIDASVIRGLPVPCDVTISVGEAVVDRQTATERELELSSTTPGVFKVLVEKFPYLPWTAEFEAVG